ncbi:MAG: amidohydrolase [Micromonosporaceae bacterium]|nr:amidohydrolase [Micromonosporaceae bacterium]
MHAHLMPDALPSNDDPGFPKVEPAQTADGGNARLLISGQMRFTARDAFFDPEARLAEAAASGVDVEVVSPFPPLLNYTLPPLAGRELCRAVNRYIGDLHQRWPDHFYGFGTVPLQDPDLAAAELGELRALGLHGVEIASNIVGTPLGDERFLGFFQEAERLGLPVFVHAMPNPSDNGKLPFTAVGSYGMAAEIGMAAASLVASGTVENCPNLRLALSHGAGGFPLMLPRAQFFWGGTWDEAPPDPAVPPSGPPGVDRPAVSPIALARRFYYDALVFDRRALRYLIDLVGPTRLIVGTDFPAMNRQQPVDGSLRSLDIPQSTVEDITWNNCFRFLAVPAPAVPAPAPASGAAPA